MPNDRTDEPRFTANEVQILNMQAWDRAIDRCKSIINQVADDYAFVGAAVTARQIRCVALLLTGVKPHE